MHQHLWLQGLLCLSPRWLISRWRSIIYQIQSIPLPSTSLYIPAYKGSGVSIITQNNIPIHIYSPPGIGINISQFSDYFSTLGHRFISGGDYNAKYPKWGNRSPNTRGRALLNCITYNNLSTLAPPDPTYWPSHNNRLPDILDFFVYKLPSNIQSTINNLYDLSFDHTPTLLKIGLSPSTPNGETLTPGRMDWSIFKKTLNDNIKLNISLKTTDEANDALDSLTSTIQSAALCASITKTNKSSHNKTPHHIQILLAEKRKARAK